MLNFIGMVVPAALTMVVANALITMDFSRAARMSEGGTKTSRLIISLLAALLLGTALVTSHEALAAGESGGSSSSASHHPDLDYLKGVNSVAPPLRSI